MYVVLNCIACVLVQCGVGVLPLVWVCLGCLPPFVTHTLPSHTPLPPPPPPQLGYLLAIPRVDHATNQDDFDIEGLEFVVCSH